MRILLCRYDAVKPDPNGRCPHHRGRECIAEWEPVRTLPNLEAAQESAERLGEEIVALEALAIEQDKRGLAWGVHCALDGLRICLGMKRRVTSLHGWQGQA